MPAVSSAPSTTTSIPLPAVSIYPDPELREAQPDVVQIICGITYGFLILLTLGLAFFCGHRYHKRKQMFADEACFKDLSFLGRLKRPYHFVRLLFTPNVESKRDVELGTRSLPRTPTFPPLPSRTSTFDQKLPPYSERGAPMISEEQPGASVRSAGRGEA
ncbi:hypothetical protein NEOLEDRAFT_1175579 [Neolentinus lepideus HHB14362 ss-1]|uniref:Uncharacterized protein n=1 Tax=Neolentinus lepideus HHB14362 ss-1 TaxID=1314782 RepID=A0A165UUJ3_9AGAM|nr:hypothetical protein NEOLEDRAFT_1175579 [Neolentinus lepideus HHB14362 ss-1]